jgi:asparagine synthase (glutamine-hydrolysing)
MCGIFSLLNNSNQFTSIFIEEQFRKGVSRGPEDSKLQQVSIKAQFGFHRLAINGLNVKSNQPLIYNDVSLICNGEIYNYKELYKMLGVEPTTDSDCEVIIHLYKKYGIEYTLQMLDGVFAFVLCDNKLSSEDSQIYVARDPYGVRPLYVLKAKDVKHKNECKIDNMNIVAFASEMKVLIEFSNLYPDLFMIEHVEPGTFLNYIQKIQVMANWELKYQKHYHSTGFDSTPYKLIDYSSTNAINIIKKISYYLKAAVKKRVLITDRPIACLLSGGLDSSLITALVNDEHKRISPNKPLETYSIGLAGSEDLRNARIVADYLGTNHTEILLTEQDFIDVIPEVIRVIESYDTTTVRASIGNYLLGKYISEHSDAKVIFNGDGSDELCGGYLYMHKAPSAMDFDHECKRLLKDIHAFDVLRSDKCISSHGLEPRTPFLDREWVQFYLSIYQNMRYHTGTKSCEKWLLRTAFSEKYFVTMDSKPLLPDEILWRRKEAFSDGVSKQTRSLYEIIQEHINKNCSVEIHELFKKDIDLKHNTPQTLEQQYYRLLFESHYPGMSNVVPYFWMPRFVEGAKDASARTLDFYNSTDSTESNNYTSL